MNNFKTIVFGTSLSLIAILALPLQTHAAFTLTQIHSFFQDPAYISSNPPSYVSPTYYFDPGGYQTQCATYATSLGYTSTTDFYCAYSGILHTGTAGAGDFGTGGNGGPIPIAVYNGVFTLYTTPLTTIAYSQLYTQMQTAWNAWFAGFSTNPSAPLPQSPNVCGTESFDMNDLWGSAPYSAAKYSAANAADPTARCNVYHNAGTPSSLPVATLTANPSSVVGGSASALTYTCTNGATAASINNGVGSVAPASGGTVSVTPGSTTTYTLTCTNAQGSATSAATVTVLSGLTASCSVSPTAISSGSSATWTAVASGGAGSYTYSWTGTDGLTGTGSSISHLYSNLGANTASVTVTSGAQTITQACSNSVTVNGGSCVWKYVDSSDTVDLWGNVFQRCALSGTSSLPQCAPGLDQSADGTNAPPGPPPACKISSCEKLKKVGPGCTVGSTADLTAGSISPTTAAAGTPVTLQSNALNTGSGTSGSFPVLFQVQSPADYRVSLYQAPLAADAFAPVSVSYTFPSVGTYQVRACANFADTSFATAIVPESDYSNNCGPWTAITVTAAASPSLSCTASPGAVGASGGRVSWTVTPSGGATGPYTWTPIGFFGYFVASATSVYHDFVAADAGQTYGMHVSSASVPGGIDCSPSVAVGSVCSGTPTGTITATPNRVKSGVDKFTLTVSNVSNVTTSCTITGPGVNQTISASACTVTGISIPNLGPITTQSVYRLTCDGTKVGEAIVNILPNFREF